MALNPTSSRPNDGGLTPVASTGNAGYALINGTGTVLSYTTPNDGALHPVVVTFGLHITQALTGGTISFAIAGTVVHEISLPLIGQDPGWFAAPDSGGVDTVMSLPANTTVTIDQADAVVSGAAVAYIQIMSA